MKKMFLAITFTITLAPLFAQSVSPFILPASERWQGRIAYTDAEGKRQSDLYEIVFVKGGTCIITVRAKENGADVYLDGDGLWSESEDGMTGAHVLRIECDFPDSPLPRLTGVRWASLYQFDSGATRFTLLVPPYPDARNVRVQFVRTEE